MPEEKARFIGRKEELERLEGLFNKKIPSLLVIKGRRRIGKSRLITEFAKGRVFYNFTGLPPEENITAQEQRDEFAKQLDHHFALPGLKADDWGDLFLLLAKQVTNKQTVILLDEISWMGSKDPTFLGKLKIAWDLHFSQKPKLVLVLCGSVSTWIEENILKSTGFFGRVTCQISLEELSIQESSQFLDSLGFKGSKDEKNKFLAITGGVPRYIELYEPQIPIVENIKMQCFDRDGLLVSEFKNIFHDLFAQRGDIYETIVEALVKQALEYKEIVQKTKYTSSGKLSGYIGDLISSAYISNDYSWSFSSGKISKLIKYRLRDNYLRFYLKYIGPNKAKIAKRQYKDFSISSLPAWDSIMGLQFENLVLHNRNLILKELRISGFDIVMDNPYFQRKTLTHAGVQIDYLIQTKLKVLYLCEIKSSPVIKKSILAEMQEKIKRLKKPRGFAVCPILIHAGAEIDDSIEEEEFFLKIIDFNKFL